MKTLNPVMIRALRQAARSELSGMINDLSLPKTSSALA
jgi:hypothetical protein